jgi:hypothetical protein
MLKTLLQSIGCFLLLTACTEHLGTKPMATEPEPRFQLSPEQLASLRPGVSPEALERMLARIPPARRAEFLRFFRRDVRAGIVETDNAEAQSLFTELWASDRVRQTLEESSRTTPSWLKSGITLVLSPRLDEHGTGALVIRDPGEPPDMIVLGEEYATAPQLFRAIGVLMEDRLMTGHPVNPVRITVEPVRIPEGVEGADEAARMAEKLYGGYIQQLLRSRRESLPPFGRVRMLKLSSFGQQAEP